METHLEETYSPIHILPVRWDEHLARLVSDLLSPPVTGLISLLVVAYAARQPSAWLWVSIAVILTIGVPVSYILWKVRRGEISDFHIPIRSQRIRPMILVILCVLLTLLIFWLGHAPAIFFSMLVFSLILSVIILLITLRWKISAHSAAIAALAMLCVQFISQALLPMMLLIPLVAWARVRIRRHTLAQTIAGAALGIVYISLVLA